MAKKIKSGVVPKINYPKEPKIKFVKKANMWCKTYFEKDNLGRMIQKQEWTVENPNV